jgi:hypothetical protein
MTQYVYIPKFFTEPGKFYFGAKCPTTQNILAIEPDPDRGDRLCSHGWDMAPCHHCQTHHKFEKGDIFSFQATEDEPG